MYYIIFLEKENYYYYILSNLLFKFRFKYIENED